MVNRYYLMAYRILLVMTVGLIALGGATRAADAGLACPDWPLCFGRFVPDFHPQVYFEFIHRALAGTIGIFVVTLHGLLFFDHSVKRSVKWVAASSLVILIAQIVLGGLTVLQLLKSGIVTLHLAFGTAFFSSMLWVFFNLRGEPGQEEVPASYSLWTRLQAFVVYGQILLGGWVASNYAGLACVDFPTCNGVLFPEMVGHVGIHMIHRFGAYTTAFVVLLNLLWVHRLGMSERLRSGAWYMAALILVQICLGVANVKFLIPPLITVLHLVTAVALLALSLRSVFWTRAATSPMTGRLRVSPSF